MEENTVELDDAVDIEEHARRGERPPRERRYVIRVDRQRVVVESATISGAEILRLVGKSSDKYKLYQHLRGQQPVLVEPATTIDLTTPGIERFTTMPKDTTE